MLQNTYSYTVVSAKKFMVIINVYLERSEEYIKKIRTPIIPILLFLLWFLQKSMLLLTHLYQMLSAGIAKLSIPSHPTNAEK